MTIEKRGYQRIDIGFPVKLVLSSGETIAVSGANLSAGGLAILYEAPADNGTQFTLSFSITSEGVSRTVQAIAEVIHNHLGAAKSLYVIGMNFVQISEEDRLALEHYVKSLDQIRSMN